MTETPVRASDPALAARIALLCALDVPLSSLDIMRVEDVVAAALQALDEAVKGNLFDTEPQAMDVVLRKLAKRDSHDTDR